MNHSSKLPATFQAAWDQRATKPKHLPADAVLRHEGEGVWTVRSDIHHGMIARFQCEALMGCETVAVSTHVWLIDSLRRKGIGRWMRGLRIDACRLAGFRLEQCTARDDNEPQIRVLLQTGGRKVATFPSDHGGTVSLWVTELT